MEMPFVIARERSARSIASAIRTRTGTSIRPGPVPSYGSGQRLDRINPVLATDVTVAARHGLVRTERISEQPRRGAAQEIEDPDRVAPG